MLTAKNIHMLLAIKVGNKMHYAKCESSAVENTCGLTSETKERCMRRNTESETDYPHTQPQANPTWVTAVRFFCVYYGTSHRGASALKR